MLAKESSNRKDLRNSPNKGGFFLERRKEASPDLDDKSSKSETSSLKRFTKYINQCIKSGKRSSKVFSLARINVLEIESIEAGDARNFDESLKSIILDFLRKSDRIYSNQLGSYLILMPSTNRKNAVKALTRITEALSDYSFSQNDFVIRPSSVFTLIPEDAFIERSAQELLEELGVAVLDSNYVSKPDQNELFTGSTSEWFMRYNFDKEPFLKILLDGELKLRTYKGFDVWAEHRSILLREISFKSLRKSLMDHEILSLVQILRQMQALGRLSISPLCDFHLVNEKIYLVNYIPEFERCVSILEPELFENKISSQFREDVFKKVVFELAGSLSYLHSLVPPTVLSNYDNLLLFYNSLEEGEAADIKILNYDLERLTKVLLGKGQDLKPHEDLIGFARYVLKLNEIFFQSDDEELLGFLSTIARQSSSQHIDKKYNSFSKLRSYLKEKAPAENA